MLDDPSMLSKLKEMLFGTMAGMSVMRPVGTGIATENKLLSSKDCYFHVLEWFPYDQNELKSDTDEMKDAGTDAKGEAYEVSVQFGKSVKATWLPQGGNRSTAPDIRRGERAEIFRLADSDTYYWRPIELDQGVRRLETAVFLYSNTQDESTKELTPENSWVVEISTHQKTLSVMTPKSDGEAFGYTIQLNTKDSTFVLQDDGGQTFQLNSPERFWHIANNDGSEITVDKKNISFIAPEKFYVKCKDYLLEADNSITEKTKTHTAESQTYTLKTQTYNNTSNAYKVSTGTMQMSYGNGALSGATSFLGSLTNNGINVGSSHRHGGVDSGPSTTSTPI